MEILKNKRLITQITIILFTFTLTNCAVRVGTNHTTVKAKPLPPGQAKKITGEKSAKNYAPGHNK
ncbi:hypothetical protein [Flavobacterium gilvum]|uniref:Quinol oxidase subunit 4 n=1 Tax=Flavobacterium gilvum TaxID=1492737 RepID=A0AAC9I1V9_9FLAO|nr:hypothetical protein [Flavobacterium gilvum]AOW08599.1 hypothetical protein EM308_03305 [Flavobacterium gilvum]KFC59697.1 hypothetical protein FEM08_14780 [Flavobacterium gilvum]